MLDMLSLLVGSVGVFLVTDPAGFRFAILTGVLLAVVFWYACYIYTRLWNKRYHMTPIHHMVCALAALITLAVAILYPAVDHVRKAEEASIALWQATINGDKIWAKFTLDNAYQAVRKLGIEDFTDIGPGGTGSWIPTSHDESRQTAAGVYATSAWEHFTRSRPFLSTVLSGQRGIPTDVVFADVRRWQQTDPNYPPRRAIELAVQQIRASLEAQTQQLVSALHMKMVFAFVLAQGLAFGLAGWAAYRDIKVRA